MKHSSPFDEIPANLSKAKRYYLGGDFSEASAYYAEAYVAGRPWLRDNRTAFDFAVTKAVQEWDRAQRLKVESP